jgi:hypothetical protein
MNTPSLERKYTKSPNRPWLVAVEVFILGLLACGAVLVKLFPTPTAVVNANKVGNGLVCTGEGSESVLPDAARAWLVDHVKAGCALNEPSAQLSSRYPWLPWLLLGLAVAIPVLAGILSGVIRTRGSLFRARFRLVLLAVFALIGGLFFLVRSDTEAAMGRELALDKELQSTCQLVQTEWAKLDDVINAECTRPENRGACLECAPCISSLKQLEVCDHPTCRAARVYQSRKLSIVSEQATKVKVDCAPPKATPAEQVVSFFGPPAASADTPAGPAPSSAPTTPLSPSSMPLDFYTPPPNRRPQADGGPDGGSEGGPEGGPQNPDHPDNPAAPAPTTPQEPNRSRRPFFYSLFVGAGVPLVAAILLADLLFPANPTPVQREKSIRIAEKIANREPLSDEDLAFLATLAKDRRKVNDLLQSWETFRTSAIGVTLDVQQRCMAFLAADKKRKDAVCGSQNVQTLRSNLRNQCPGLTEDATNQIVPLVAACTCGDRQLTQELRSYTTFGYQCP